MRRLSWLIPVAVLAAALLAVSKTATARGPYTERGVVTRVVDGETLVVRTTSGKVVRVRILGVEAPTGAECHARAAAARTTAVARGKRVVVTADGTAAARDAQRRLLAYVRLPDGSDLGRILVADGAAQADVWGRPFARFPTYAATQQLAEKNVRGLWRACGTDLSVTLEPAAPAAAAGAAVEYTLAVANRGALVAHAVSVDLRPPPDAAFASLPESCSSVGWHATCTFGDVAPGAKVEARFSVTLNRLGIASVRAAASFAACVRAPCGRVPATDTDRDNDTAGALVVVLKELIPGAEPPSLCDASYPTVCLPSPPPDLDCNDISFREFYVRRDIPDFDPHRFDQSEDGIGCQFDDY